MISDWSVRGPEEFSPPSPSPGHSPLCAAGRSVPEQPFPLSNVERSRQIPILEFAPQPRPPGLRQGRGPERSELAIIEETLSGGDISLRRDGKEQVGSGSL